MFSAEFSEWSECSGNCEDEDGTHSRVNLSTGDIETEPCNRIRCRKYLFCSCFFLNKTIHAGTRIDYT